MAHLEKNILIIENFFFFLARNESDILIFTKISLVWHMGKYERMETEKLHFACLSRISLLASLVNQHLKTWILHGLNTDYTYLIANN